MDIHRLNQLKGAVENAETDGRLSLITVNVNGELFTALSDESLQNAAWLQPGRRVTLQFSAGDMAVAKNISGELSIRNRFAATVTHIKEGRVLTTLSLDYQGIPLYAVITSHAARALHITEGDLLTGLVKSTEMKVTEG